MHLNLSLYFILTISIVAFACFVVIFSNPIFSVLALISVFVTSAGMLLLHGVDFLAFSLIIVYVGAIAVLFLFVVMMLDIKIQRQQFDIVQIFPIFLGLVIGFLSQVITTFNEGLGNFFLIEAGQQKFFFWDQEIDSFLSDLEPLGQVLYTKYVFVFLLAGILLLIAMIGAIVLTLQSHTESYHQDLTSQLTTSRLTYSRR